MRRTCRSSEPLLRPAKDTPTPPSPKHTYFCPDWPQFVTELLQPNVNSVTRGAVHEFGMADATTFPDLVKSCCMVVGSADPGQRGKYRDLVRALPAAP